MAMEDLVSKVNGNIIAKIAILTEGDKRSDVMALGHLPLFFDE